MAMDLVVTETVMAMATAMGMAMAMVMEKMVQGIILPMKSIPALKTYGE